MRHSPVSPVVLAAALSACALEPELLNSERITERFGSYGIEVLEQSDSLRRSNLYSSEDGVRTCRTYAVVQFADLSSSAVADAHREVLAGQSIGTTFKESGWVIAKDTVHIGSVSISGAEHDVTRLMRIASVGNLAMHIYRLLLERNGQSLHYATIVEAHHPEYLSEAALHDLYDQDATQQLDPAAVAAFVALIQSD